MAMDHAEARRALWARYDAGEATAEEVEARLVLLDRTPAGDEAAVRAALDGSIPLRRRVGSRGTGLVLGGIALVLFLIGGAVLAGEHGRGTPPPTSGVFTTGPVTAVPLPPGGFPGPTIVGGAVVAEAEPAECATAERADIPTDAAASAALLSEPPFLPEGYEVDDDEAITPGTDPDLTMSIAAGDPLPDEIRARVLAGALAVRMRTWRYIDAETSGEAALAAALSGCSYDAEEFEVPDHPELGGSVVTGVIPTTAFVGWRLGDRRFIVAVESAGDDPDAVEEARQLAGAIAVGELEAARNPPPAPAP
jgi:hypothetical protein